MILEIITLIANALFKSRISAPKNLVVYDSLTPQILELSTDVLKDLSPEGNTFSIQRRARILTHERDTT